MAMRLMLDNPPEFYTNLDVVSGKVVLFLNRPEQIGSIVVKLEGEAITAVQPQGPYGARPGGGPSNAQANMVAENHKILYRVQQVFPDDYHASSSSPYGSYPLNPGQHEYTFKFKLPINNACSDPNAMAKIGGLGGQGGYGQGGGLFGIGGVRVMDGSKQLFYRHVTQTLPPSITGFPMQAEIRYYIKVTAQRPGFLKENWRTHVGLKFLPIEPPRPQATGQESFARRPFIFKPITPSQLDKKRSSFFSKKGSKEEKGSGFEEGDGRDMGEASKSSSKTLQPPSLEVTARLPHPPLLTCNTPIPLKLIVKKLSPHTDEIYLVSFELELVGYTEIRARGISNIKSSRWPVATHVNLNHPLRLSTAEVGQDVPIPDDLWKDRPLPNTIAPSFTTCNLTRRYALEIKLGLAWGKPSTGLKAKMSSHQPQALYLPLHFESVQVFSGIKPPAELLQSARAHRPGRAIINTNPPLSPFRMPQPGSSASPTSPAPQQQTQQQQQNPPPQPPRPAPDPLYPPQLQPGQRADDGDAPPSYDEAVAENLSGPFDGTQSRPAYSGITNENAPSEMPRTKGQ